MSVSTTTRQPGFLQGLFLLLPVTLSVVGVTVFMPTVALMQANFKALPNGDYLVNLLQTMPGFWLVAFSPIAGWLADKFGRKQILIWSMVFYAVAGIAPFFMTDMYPILATRCIVGMCESVVMTVSTTMLCDYFKGPTRERWLASQTGVASLSALLIIPMGGILGAIFGWQGPFLVYLISLVWLVGIASFCWEPAREDPASIESAALDVDARYTTIPVLRMAGILLITLVGSVMFYTTITQNANAFVALGVTNPAEIGRYATLASLGVPIGTVLFWWLNRLHIAYLLFIEFLLIGVGFTWMSAATTPMEYVYAANMQQIGCGLILPTLLVWATKGLAYRIRGRGNGLWQGAFGLGLFVSGMALTFLGSQVGGLIPAFALMGKACFVAAVTAMLGKFIWNKRAGAGF